ncbi:MAG: MMPL family transporter [Tetrasphaera jenkinsii]|jgi:putative drug exporter of the RND superfamily|nr:MMPL family transporter [Tetrasphaera jenkinsii]
MAQLLQRLGRFCADYAGRVLAFWAVILLAIGGAAASFGTPMTNEFRFPGAAFEKVGEDLGAALPELRGGFGTVVFETQSGEFTPAQREAIKTTLAKWQQVPQVTGVVDPFAAQERIDAADDKLATAKVKLDQGYADLAANRTKLDQANYSLAQGQGLIELAERKNPKDPGLTTLRPQVAAAEKKLAAAEAKWEQGRDQLDAGWAAYTQGKQQADALGDVRFVSQDGHVAVAQIRFDTDARSVPYEIRAEIPAIGSSLTKSGVTVNYSAEIAQEMSLVGPGEIIGLGVALLVLLAMLGSLVAAGLPLVGAMLGVGVGLGGAVAATHFFAMNQMTPSLALMLGLAVGIDYALFIVNRHRQMYLGGTDLRASIARAVGTAGSAVAFAGLTVIIALTALVLSGLPILAQMGLVAAGTVLAAVLVALTVTPALLRVIGPRVAAKKTWRNHGYAVPGDPASRSVSGGAGLEEGAGVEEGEEEHGGWYVRLVTRRPWLTTAGVVAVIAVLAAPLFSLRLGLPDGSSEPASSTAYAAYEGVATNFGPGVNGPIVAVATLDKAPADDAALQAIQARLASTFDGIDGVAGVAVAGVSADQRTIAMQVVPTTGPAEAPTVETVNAITDRARFLSAELGADIGVTGQTVANIEISQRLSDALPGYLATVIGLSLIILLLVFRSVLVPLIATVGFLFSVAAAFGVTVAVYQWGWLADLFGVTEPGPIMSFMPIILIGVLFGLAMDYQMFLVSGMREAHVHGQDARTAVRTGFEHGAKVVTAAALIMFAVFGGFVFAHLTMIRPIGLGLAVGVIVDAVIVRMTLVPALMHLLGERAWWMPAWLDRVVPNVDVEGASLAPENPAGEQALEDRSGVAGTHARRAEVAEVTV